MPTSGEPIQFGTLTFPIVAQVRREALGQFPRIHALLENAGVAIWTIDPKHGRITGSADFKNLRTVKILKEAQDDPTIGLNIRLNKARPGIERRFCRHGLEPGQSF